MVMVVKTQSRQCSRKTRPIQRPSEFRQDDRRLRFSSFKYELVKEQTKRQLNSPSPDKTGTSDN